MLIECRHDLMSSQGHSATGGKRQETSNFIWDSEDGKVVYVITSRAQVESNRKLGATVLRVRGSRVNCHADSALLVNPDAGTGLRHVRVRVVRKSLRYSLPPPATCKL